MRKSESVSGMDVGGRMLLKRDTLSCSGTNYKNCTVSSGVTR